MSTFLDWQSACRFLNKKIERLKPLSGSNIILEQSASGQRISLTKEGRSGGGGGYGGYFKVVDYSEDGVAAAAIIDGRLTSAARMESPAGCAVINDTLVECEPGQLALEPGVSYITAEFTLSDDVPVFEGYLVRHFFAASEGESLSVLLAIVETGKNSLRIYQQQYGVIYNYIFRSC